jgi:hypothetical protein
VAFFCVASTCSFAQQSKFMDESWKHYCDCETNPSTSTTLLGQKILDLGYEIALIKKEVIKGSCWDFVNEVYKRAGASETMATIYKSKLSGPFASAQLVQPGDWVYHINHQFNNIEHSAIFICWKDFKKSIAITLSYSGMNRNVPAKYGEYQLTSIYNIFRPLLAK